MSNNKPNNTTIMLAASILLIGLVEAIIQIYYFEYFLIYFNV